MRLRSLPAHLLCGGSASSAYRFTLCPRTLAKQGERRSRRSEGGDPGIQIFAKPRRRVHPEAATPPLPLLQQRRQTVEPRTQSALPSRHVAAGWASAPASGAAAAPPAASEAQPASFFRAAASSFLPQHAPPDGRDAVASLPASPPAGGHAGSEAVQPSNAGSAAAHGAAHAAAHAAAAAAAAAHAARQQGIAPGGAATREAVSGEAAAPAWMAAEAARAVAELEAEASASICRAGTCLLSRTKHNMHSVCSDSPFF